MHHFSLSVFIVKYSICAKLYIWQCIRASLSILPQALACLYLQMPFLVEKSMKSTWHFTNRRIWGRSLKMFYNLFVTEKNVFSTLFLPCFGLSFWNQIKNRISYVTVSKYNLFYQTYLLHCPRQHSECLLYSPRK